MSPDIETLRDYLETNDVVVQFEKGGICAFWKSKSFPLITINTNVRGNNRLYVMLHEAGHHMNWTKQLDQDMLLEEYTAWCLKVLNILSGSSRPSRHMTRL